MQKRIRFMIVIFAIVAVAITGKLGYEQFIRSDTLENKALNTRLREISTKPDRGVIYDRKGNALAISLATESLYINPKIVRDDDDEGDVPKEIVAQNLANILGIDVNTILEKIEKNTSFEYIKRHVDDEQVKQIRKLSYRGVYFHEEAKRSYPKGTLASQVIGFAGIDNQGLNGLELAYEKELVGNGGKVLIEYDGGGNEIPLANQQFIPPEAGHNIYLTIDETIQYIVERELKKVVLEQNAAGATGLVMDVKTGAFLAMANYPDYDPNHYNAYDTALWNNPAVSGLYEPGSTFKILTSAMALEERVTSATEEFYCPGYYYIGKMKMNCHKAVGHGNETFADGVANSCNPVFAEVVERIGKEKFYDYMHGFGMDVRTKIDLPGEARSLMVGENAAVPYDLAAMSIGQANAYTPVQMITAISAVANGGELMEPYVVQKITDKNGNVLEERQPKVVRRVISQDTAQELWGILENVVANGTGKRGAVEGYKIAGKTGTAQKVSTAGGYSADEKVVSFAGFAPADNPQIACIVIVDTSTSEAGGGLVAGPVFSSILEDTLRYLEVPRTVALQEDNAQQQEVYVPALDACNAMEAINAMIDAGLNPVVETQGEIMYTYIPAGGTKVPAGTDVYLYCAPAETTEFVMPDLTGKNIKEVDRILNGLGLTPAITGSGLAYRQSISPGELVTIGAIVNVSFVSGNEIERMQEEEKMQQEMLEKEEKAAKSKN